ncbi:MAG: hypothetical protein AAF500_10655 [Myxococcota bacterium]
MPRALLVGLLLGLIGCRSAAEPATAETPEPEPSKGAAEVAEDIPPELAQPIEERLAEVPPQDPNAWLREIEKDPIAALDKLDPGALSPSRTGRPSAPSQNQIRPTSRPGPAVAKYNAKAPLEGWPPVVGRPYPEIALLDQSGRVTSLSELRGKVVLVELVGMTCKACHAFAGGNEPSTGRFRSITPQKGLGSIDHYAQRFGKLSLDHPDVVFVQLVLYGMDGQTPPSLEDIQAWSRHFGMDRYRNEIVLLGDERFISPQTRRLIPGFHLIDRQGILRAMNSNDPRSDNLYTSLLPSMGQLANTR